MVRLAFQLHREELLLALPLALHKPSVALNHLLRLTCRKCYIYQASNTALESHPDFVTVHEVSRVFTLPSRNLRLTTIGNFHLCRARRKRSTRILVKQFGQMPTSALHSILQFSVRNPKRKLTCQSLLRHTSRLIKRRIRYSSLLTMHSPQHPSSAVVLMTTVMVARAE